MIRLIAAHEFIAMIRDGRFRLAGGIVGTLLIISMATGWTHYRTTRSQHEAAESATRQHWVDQGAKNPHSAAHYGVYAFKPRLALSFVDKGVDPYTGTSVWLEAHRQNDFLMRPAQDASQAQRFGTLTAGGVLQNLVPLLIVLLAFGAFSEERERGTLRQLLAQGGTRWKLALGKCLGVSASLMVMLVPAALIGAGALLLGSQGWAEPTLGRGLTLALAYLAYFSVFALVSIAVSAIMPSSRAALLALLAFWAFNGLLAPRLATDVSRRAHPTPSAFAFSEAMQRHLETGFEDVTPVDAEALEARVLAEHGADRIEDLPVNFDGIRLQASEEFANQVFDRQYGALWDTFERQAQVHAGMATVAPLLAIRNLSMGLAGTDIHQHRDFAEAAEAYRRRLVRALNEDMTVHSRTGDWTYRQDQVLWEAIEPFEYQAPGLAQVMGNHKLAWTLLGGWVIAASLAFVFGVRRAPIS